MKKIFIVLTIILVLVLSGCAITTTNIDETSLSNANSEKSKVENFLADRPKDKLVEGLNEELDMKEVSEKEDKEKIKEEIKVTSKTEKDKIVNTKNNPSKSEVKEVKENNQKVKESKTKVEKKKEVKKEEKKDKPKEEKKETKKSEKKKEKNDKKPANSLDGEYNRIVKGLNIQSGLEEAVLKEINKSRKEAGLKELKMNSELRKLARIKSADMHLNKYFSHTSPNYGSFSSFAKKYINVGKRVGENLMKTWSGAKGNFIHGEFMGSPSHKENIMNSAYSEVGIGIISDGSNIFITQTFRSR